MWVLDNAIIGQDAVVKPYSVISNSEVGPEASVGPFAHLRMDSRIAHKAAIGNFVELKKTEVREGAKAQHLAYLGDGDVGASANIGAGTIFCNWSHFKTPRPPSARAPSSDRRARGPGDHRQGRVCGLWLGDRPRRSRRRPSGRQGAAGDEAWLRVSHPRAAQEPRLRRRRRCAARASSAKAIAPRCDRASPTRQLHPVRPDRSCPSRRSRSRGRGPWARQRRRCLPSRRGRQ